MIRFIVQTFSLAPLLFVWVLLSSCEDTKPREYFIYDGPTVEIHNIDLFYNDSSGLVMKLQADKQFELKNQDQVFPEGLFVTFFNDKREIVNTIKADSAYFVKIANVWHAYGDVQVKNITKKESLFTEELTWNTTAHQLVTEAHVRVESPTQVLTGVGLVAKDDFSEYEIQNPVIDGEF